MLKRFFHTLLAPGSVLAKFFLALLVIGFYLLSYLEGLQPLEDFLKSDMVSLQIGDFEFTLYGMLQALLTLLVLIWATGVLTSYMDSWVRQLKGIRSSNQALVIKVSQVAIYVLAFFIGLDILGINLKALAIFSGAIGIGIGFGLRKITSNFISGLILLAEESVEPDDLIELGDGTFGYLRRTNARYSVIETFAGEEVMIPNEDFITSRVTNLTCRNKKGRVSINMGVSYAADLEKTKKLMIEAANEHPLCLSDPEPACFLREFADSSINFSLFFWVGDVNKGRFGPKSDVLMSIWRKFKENNIEIPFPQQDIHIHRAANTTNEQTI